ncbi:MAG: hypothetical protein QM756_22530 [Polyangiaceae bacterium]
MTLDVSIPCAQCAQPVYFGQAQCSNCGTSLSSRARDALEERLAASSADYGELREQVGAARAALLVVALLHAAFGLIGFVSQVVSPLRVEGEDPALAWLLGNLVLTGLLLGCWHAARRAPAAALLVASAIWTVGQALGASQFQFLSFRIPLLRLAALLLLLRGVVAALKASRIRRRMRKARQASPG